MAKAYFFDGQHTTADGLQVEHIDFTPAHIAKRCASVLLAAAHTSNIDLTAQAVYGATQGPRFGKAVPKFDAWPETAVMWSA